MNKKTKVLRISNVIKGCEKTEVSLGAGWLEVNGSKFGLCRVFENEWWHFEPVIAPGWKCPALVPDATNSVD